MAVRKPLVLVSGRIQQLQSGDSIGAFETGQVTLTAAATLIAGNAVYASAAATVDKARANATGTSNVIGLATTGITSSATGVIQVNGVLTLTTTEWDAVAGTTGGLTYNTTYFLSAGTAGLLTSTAPSTVGQTVVEIGTALSTTDLAVSIKSYVLL
jgi:hypothetical protein